MAGSHEVRGSIPLGSTIGKLDEPFFKGSSFYMSRTSSINNEGPKASLSPLAQSILGYRQKSGVIGRKVCPILTSKGYRQKSVSDSDIQPLFRTRISTF